jgi:D-alanine-D-alanine ligase
MRDPRPRALLAGNGHLISAVTATAFYTMTNVAILTGGTSSEREIAIASSQTVAKALEGRVDTMTFDFPSEINAFLSRRHEFDVAIPVFHGRGGEDGTVQGFLETLGMPYLFSGVTAHAIAMDKDLAKRIVSSAGIQTACWSVIARSETTKQSPERLPRFARNDSKFPCVVKPADGGSTQGASVVRDQDGLHHALADAFQFSSRVLVEDFLQGDEFTVAVAEDQGAPVALPVIQIKSPSGIYDFNAKYGPQPAEKLCPAPIAADLARRLQDAALTVHKTIGARHLSRTDFIVDAAGEIWFLEINTIPGLSVLFPRAVAAGGLDFGELLIQWIKELI